jgi:hypothetical protein
VNLVVAISSDSSASRSRIGHTSKFLTIQRFEIVIRYAVDFFNIGDGYTI